MLELLVKLFGKAYVNRMIGTGTNVSKPIKLDKNSPFKLYSDSAFKDSKTLNFIEEKIMEYGPFALSNKNASEIANFEANARRLLNARQPKESQVKKAAEAMFGPIGKKEKPEAEVFDIATSKKVDDEGIMTLKSELGLPKGVEPGSTADKAIKESVEYKTKQQGVKSVLDEDYVPPKTLSLDEMLEEELSLDKISKMADNIKAAKMSEKEARAYSANIESYRRPIIRQMLLKDTRINLSDDVRKSLENKDDLQRGADPEMDPLRLLNEYYDVDFKKLDELEDIRFTAGDEFEAADEFLQKGGLKPKKTIEDDFDPDDEIPFATGGRVNYSTGTKLRIAKFLKDKGKTLITEVKKAVDDIIPSGDSKYDADVAIDNMLEDLGVDREMFDEKDIMNLYGVAYNSLIEKSVPQGLANMITKKGKGKVTTADKVVLADEVKLEKEMRDLQNNPMDFVKTVTPKFYERMELKIKYPGITDELIKKIMIDDNPQRKAEVLATLDEAFKMSEKGMDADAILNAIKNTPRTKQADGGLNYLMGM